MENYINIFGLEVSIDPVAFTIPGIDWKVYWYGIIITIGFCLALLYGFKKAKSFGIDSDRLMDAAIVTAPVAILCARLYYVIFDPNTSITDFFSIHDGGLAILGAVIGAVAAGALMCKLRKINFLSALDLTSLGFLIGQSVGRWGNFVNQEAYGYFTGSSWFGMTGSEISKDLGTTALVHPCFLYESIWCALGFVLLHILSKRRKFNGQIATVYMIWYGFGRFFIEGLRTDSLYFGSVRASQLLSALMVIAGIIILLVVHFKNRKVKVEENYEPIFASEDGFDGEYQDEETEELSKEEYDEIEKEVLDETEQQAKANIENDDTEEK